MSLDLFIVVSDIMTAGFEFMTVRILGEVPVRQFLSLDEYIVVDVETTGMKAETQDIIEVGALRVRQGQVEAEFSSLVGLEKTSYLPAFITDLTGITARMLAADGRPLDEVMAGFLSFAGDRPLVGHNVIFDCRFLQAALEYCNERRELRGREALPALNNRVFDTLRMARVLYKGACHRLGPLAALLQVDNQGAHRALKDCYMAHGVLQKMMSHPEWPKWFGQRKGWVKKTVRRGGKGEGTIPESGNAQGMIKGLWDNDQAADET